MRRIRILIIGDTHIHDRVDSIPDKLLKLISSYLPWEVVLFTGDLTDEDVLEWLRSISKSLYVVRGNMDYLPLPKYVVIVIDWLKIGLIHGDGIYPRGNPVELSKIARKLKVQVLISGHTHTDFIRMSPNNDILLLNPGSLTGVWGGGGGSYTPSLMILEVSNKECINIITYRLINDTLEQSYSTYCTRGSIWSLKSYQ
jgi:putative phosphoesterase